MLKNIKELSLQELQQVLKSWGLPGFHARQVFSWIYQKGAGDFDAMSNLPLELRKLLKENFSLFEFEVKEVRTSRDGTKKYLFLLPDKNGIEAVSIPAEERLTGCVSSQVGCRYSCKFCASGLAGFKKNLTCGEIIEEVALLKNDCAPGKLTHLVFMGIGEPLDNYDNVLKAIRLINSPEAFNIGARRITISTCGIIPGIKRLEKEGLQIELSISLHAADDKTRSTLMPVNKIYPLADLMVAASEYTQKTNRQITFEYVLIKNLNSDLQSAIKLSKMIRGLKSKVNLIPCNYIPELGLEPPGKMSILFFRDRLIKAGIHVTLRAPRGDDIDSACGQLRLQHEKK
ncbi:MAG: 23S rRNA (adenine(2503)-C(2))-methyltransferase RlmN [Candidatus Omnitrophota bacterium]|jgi:23S rRNA (adenine2503-C2)-methyltransferase